MDLGSRNGTFIGMDKVRESVVQPGTKLKFGPVEAYIPSENGAIAVEAPPAPPRIPSSPPLPPPVPLAGLPSCTQHPEAAAKWRCPRCATILCPTCVRDGKKFGLGNKYFCLACNTVCEPVEAASPGAPQGQTTQTKKAGKAAAPKAALPGVSFTSLLVDSWKYPVLKDAWLYLLCATVFFGLLSFVSSINGFPLRIRTFCFVLAWGYLASYLQKIIHSSALGEVDLPQFPDFSSYYDDIVRPFFLMAGTFAASFAPLLVTLFTMRGFLADIMTDAEPEDVPVFKLLLALVFLILGLLVAPMNLLSVAMHDGIAGVIPTFTFPSIKRVGGHYALIVAQLAVVLVAQVSIEFVLGLVKIPFVPGFLAYGFQLYFIIVQARSLGMLYFKNRDNLGWF